MLGFKAARDYCGLTEGVRPDPNPIPESKIENAATVVATMFGNRSTGRSPAVVDSRQLSSLAKAFSDSEKVSLLKSGRDLETVLDLTKPIETKLEENIQEVRDILSDLVASISENPPPAEVAKLHLEPSVKARSLSVDLAKRLKEIVDREFEKFDE